MYRITRLLIAACAMLISVAGYSLIATTPAQAATIDDLRVTCSRTTLRGRTEVAAPFIRVQVVLASDLTVKLADQVIAVRNRANARYRVVVDYWQQAEGTSLVVSVGEWDGQQYLRPATLVGRPCRGGGVQASPTPLPSFTPTFMPPPASATPAGNYIAYFTADTVVIPAGGCVNLAWLVVGARRVTLLGSNWPSPTPADVENPGTATVCPSAAGGYVPGEPVTYTLGAVFLDGSTDSRAIVITYETQPSASPSPTFTPLP
jgi:hypothetical protein